MTRDHPSLVPPSTRHPGGRHDASVRPRAGPGSPLSARTGEMSFTRSVRTPSHHTLPLWIVDTTLPRNSGFSSRRRRSTTSTCFSGGRSATDFSHASAAVSGAASLLIRTAPRAGPRLFRPPARARRDFSALREDGPDPLTAAKGRLRHGLRDAPGDAGRPGPGLPVARLRRPARLGRGLWRHLAVCNPNGTVYVLRLANACEVFQVPA